jgi:hypothetical protein
LLGSAANEASFFQAASTMWAFVVTASKSVLDLQYRLDGDIVIVKVFGRAFL